MNHYQLISGNKQIKTRQIKRQYTEGRCKAPKAAIGVKIEPD